MEEKNEAMWFIFWIIAAALILIAASIIITHVIDITYTV